MLVRSCCRLLIILVAVRHLILLGPYWQNELDGHGTDRFMRRNIFLYVFYFRH